MPQLSSFGQWLQETREKLLSSPTELRNEAAAQTYAFGPMLKANPERKMMQSGASFRDVLKMSDTGNFRIYTPGDPRGTLAAANTRQTVTAPWRFTENHVVYTDAQIMLNTGAVLDSWKAHREGLRKDLLTEHIRGWESLLFATPNDDMELGTTTGAAPYSIPFWIAENGQRHSALTNTTRLMGIDPTTTPNWRNATSSYDSADPGNASTGLFAAMDAIAQLVEFIPPPSAGDAYQKTQISKRLVLTSPQGRTAYIARLRASNDTFANRNDPSFEPTYNGVAVRAIEALRTAGLGALGAAWADTQARYFFIDLETLYPVFHTSRMMAVKGPVNFGAEQHDTEALFMNTWGNLVCLSRRRQGIVVPQGV